LREKNKKSKPEEGSAPGAAHVEGRQRNEFQKNENEKSLNRKNLKRGRYCSRCC